MTTETATTVGHPLDGHRIGYREHLATVRWSWGDPVPKFHGPTEGSAFLGAAKRVLEACALWRFRGAQEGVPAPFDRPRRDDPAIEAAAWPTVELWRWHQQASYSDHYGWALVNRGLPPEEFATVVQRYHDGTPKMQERNYCRPQWRHQDDTVAIFEEGGHGIGD